MLAQTPGTERWAFKPEIPGAWTGAAVGPDGSVYVGYCATNGTGHVLALDPVTGVERWRFGSGCIVSIPAVGPDGTVYVAEGDKVVALNGVTGESRWSFAGGGVFDSSPALATDGTVYLGCNDGRLYALDASTGAKRWDFSTGAAIHEAPALAADGLVYFGSNDGNFYALDTATGAKLWHFPTGGPIACSPAIGSDGTVYFGSGDKKFYAVNGRTGARRWDFTTLAPVDWSPVMVDDMVIFGANDATMYSVDAENGHFCWFLPFTTSITRAHPAVGGDGDLYVGVPTALVAMDHNSKFANWVYFLGTERSLAPVLGPDGTVFVGSYKGAFYGLWSRGAGGLADTPWPMAGQNIRRTGQAPTVPWILNEPVDQDVREGAILLLSAAVTGASPMKFQWQRDGAPLPGATNAALVLTNFQRGMVADYQLLITNALGAATSRVAKAGILTPPTIVAQPQNQTVGVGAPVRFAVECTGSRPLAYEWLRNQANLAGASGPVLSFASVGLTNSGDYAVIIRNAAGAVTSQVARLSVQLPPALSMQRSGELLLNCLPGAVCQLEHADRLAGAWLTLTNVTVTDGVFTLRWGEGGAPAMRFYRARLVLP